ncbi:MAG: DUF6785 family protein [Chloroherpetonaceae bacterium]|nr:DUF6785 family protein [Chloroherpetonaceae bacterium]
MATTADETGTAARIRKRVFGIALGGVVPLVLFVQWSDIVVGGTMAAGPFPPLAACLLWAMLAGMHHALCRLRGGRPLLTRGELLAILAVWLTANMVAGRGMTHPFLCSVAAPVYYARGATLTEAVDTYLHSGLILTDRQAARQFFEGVHRSVPWQHWVRPLCVWGLFFLPFVTAQICLCALLERVWVRHERLSFPLVALPVESLRAAEAPESARALRQAIGAGMAIVLAFHGLGVAHAYLPAIPHIPFFNDISALASHPPWSAVQPLYINLYPMLIGLTFLAPTDVTFSIWFFLLLSKLERLAVAFAGRGDTVPGQGMAQPPYLEEQSAGAFLVLAGLILWNARHALRAILSRNACQREERWFLIGFLFGGAGVLGWCAYHAIPLWFSIGYFGFYLAVVLVLSRLMAEGGMTWGLAPILPDRLLLSLTGAQALPPIALTRLMLFTQHLRDARQMLTPAGFQAGKLREEIGLPFRSFYVLLLGATLLALALSTIVALTLFYRHGALLQASNNDGLQMSAVVIPVTAAGQATLRLTGAVRPSAEAGVALLAGAGVTGGLSVLRARFPGWPLHPLGYALTGTLQVGYASKMLCSVFLGWGLKALTLRLGGARGFRLLRGVALGMILGDLLTGVVLKILDVLLGPSGYAIF